MPAPAWWIAVQALLASLLLTPLIRYYALERGLVDAPGPRRSHMHPTPRGGGLALAVSLLLVLPWLPMPLDRLLVYGLYIVILTGLGWIEDHRPIAVGWRLAVQLVAIAWLAFNLGPVRVVDFSSMPVEASWLWTPLAALAVLWLINLHNFMDGSDGLAALQCFFSGAFFAAAFALNGDPGMALLAVALAAACAGFLVWNRPPARIFMGDSGSLVLGGMIGALALTGAVNGSVSVWVGAIITSVFVIDASATLFDRLVRKERWYTAHRQHAYQRLIRRGWSHSGVLAAYAAVNLMLVLPAAVLAMRNPGLDFAVALIVGCVLLAAWGWVRCVTEPENKNE